MKSNPLVSIIMTSFNSEKYIRKAIESIIEQTYTDWELLIADDCSTDGTREVINSFDDHRIRSYHNDTNIHYLRTRTKLVSFVKGDFITFQDADDLSLANRLESLINEFKKDSALAMCGSFVQYIDEQGNKIPINDKKPTAYVEIKQQIKHRNIYTGPTIMVKTEIWNSVGGYRDYFSGLGYEDYDLTSRIIEKHKSIIIPEELYQYRQHRESTSKKDLLYNPFKYHGHFLIKKFIQERENGNLDSLQKNDISEIIHFILEKNKPYVEDPSLMMRDLMWSALKREQYGIAFTRIMNAIVRAPFNYKNYKGLILFFLAATKIVKS